MSMKHWPTPEMLRTMDVRELRETFEFGMEEAKKLKVEQRIRDTARDINDHDTRNAILDLLLLITGRDHDGR